MTNEQAIYIAKMHRLSSMMVAGRYYKVGNETCIDTRHIEKWIECYEKNSNRVRVDTMRWANAAFRRIKNNG